MQRFYRFKQLAPFIGSVSKSTLRRWIASGRFPAGTIIGENVRVWSENSLLAFQRGIGADVNGTVAKQKPVDKKKLRTQLPAAP